MQLRTGSLKNSSQLQQQEEKGWEKAVSLPTFLLSSPHPVGPTPSPLHLLPASLHVMTPSQALVPSNSATAPGCRESIIMTSHLCTAKRFARTGMLFGFTAATWIQSAQHTCSRTLRKLWPGLQRPKCQTWVCLHLTVASREHITSPPPSCYFASEFTGCSV